MLRLATYLLVSLPLFLRDEHIEAILLLVEPPNPRKKKPLTEDEIALKREETARKRKNLTEKKLEDEKASAMSNANAIRTLT